MKAQLPELSTLLDGELESHEAHALMKAAVRDSKLRQAWQTYVLIGDQLRQEGPAATDLTASVMARIQAEPVVLAPGQVRTEGRLHALLALAASVAGVAVVGWLALSGSSQHEPTVSQMATVSPAPTFMSVPSNVSGSPMTVAATASLQTDMREYLLAHHMHASSFRLGDSTEHVRTVTMTRNSNRP